MVNGTHIPTHMNKTERSRVYLVNMSNGHLLPRISFLGSRVYVHRIFCVHCGREYSVRGSDAFQHLHKKHGIAWYDKSQAAGMEEIE